MAFETCVLFVTAWLKFSITSSQTEVPIDYTGHKIVSIYIDSEEKLLHVSKLQETYNGGVQHWGHQYPNRNTVNLHVSKEHADHLENKIKEHNYTYYVICDDLGELIRMERSSPRDETLEEFGYNFGKHNDLKTITNYLHELTRNNLNVSQLSVIGTSFENRSLYSVQIPKIPRNDKLTIIIECGMHAREWTAVEACIYMIKKFINPDPDDVDVQDILSLYDIIIIPLINPDGYDYAWNKDRMWRKTRSCHKEKCSSTCIGTDGNRNFDVNFCMGFHARNNLCDACYCGEEAFSEPETAAIRNVIQVAGKRLFAYFSIHSSGAMWLTPYGKTSDLPLNFDELVRVGEIAATAIEKVNGLKFKVGHTSKLAYLCSGTSMDYAYDKGKAKYSFTLELRDGKLSGGFVLEEKEIIPMCLETFAGIKAAILALRHY